MLQYEEIFDIIGVEPFAKLEKIKLLHIRDEYFHFKNQTLIDLNCGLLKQNRKCRLYIEKTGVLPQFPTKTTRKKSKHLIYKIAIKDENVFEKRYKIKKC